MHRQRILVAADADGPWHELEPGAPLEIDDGAHYLKADCKPNGIHDEELEIGILERVKKRDRRDLKFRNPHRTILDADKDCRGAERGKYLLTLIVACWIRKGRLVIEHKDTMMMRWKFGGLQGMGRHAYRLCGRSIFNMEGMKLLYGRRGGDAHGSGAIVLGTIIELVGSGSQYPITVDVNVIEQVIGILQQSREMDFFNSTRRRLKKLRWPGCG